MIGIYIDVMIKYILKSPVQLRLGHVLCKINLCLNLNNIKYQNTTKPHSIFSDYKDYDYAIKCVGFFSLGRTYVWWHKTKLKLPILRDTFVNKWGLDILKALMGVF